MLIRTNCTFTGAMENTRVISNADETRFIALAPSDDAGYTVSWTLNAPIADSYIMLPACAYDGNRFQTVHRKYPPRFAEDEFGLNPPIRMTEVPRLAPEGDSFMDITTGDLSTPCVCVLNKKEKQAFMVFFNQGDHSLNHGVSLDQEGGLLHVSLRAPARRRLVYRWYGGIPSLQENPEADAPLSVQAGDETTIPHRIFIFPCEDIPALYRAFFEKRALLYHSGAHAVLPFSACWEMSQAQHNKDRFDGEHYHLDILKYSAVNASCQWQAGWVGGGMTTLPLIIDGNEESLKNSISTLEFAARWQSRIGLYYGCVFNGKVRFDCGGLYGSEYSMLLIRKHADMTYFMFKQMIALKKKVGIVPESIAKSAVSAADALVALWKKYGQLGQFVNAETGEILVGGSASGGIAPAALTAAYTVTGRAEYLETAREIARFYYQSFTLKGVTVGGPGEAMQAPDSESAAALMECFTALYETDETDEWLKMACDAAHQAASWVVPYDYEFPKDSRLGKRGVHAAGSVWANVQNKHSAPGLCTLSPASFLKLYRATGHENYLRIMREIAHFLTQVASTPENPMYTFNGEKLRPGEMCERVNTSDWEGTNHVGDFIFGSSSWPEASTMLTWTEIPGVYVNPDRGVVCVSDHVSAWLNGNELVIENPTMYPARVKVMIESDEMLSEPLGLYWQEKMTIATVEAGGRTTVSL